MNSDQQLMNAYVQKRPELVRVFNSMIDAFNKSAKRGQNCPTAALQPLFDAIVHPCTGIWEVATMKVSNLTKCHHGVFSILNQVLDHPKPSIRNRVVHCLQHDSLREPSMGIVERLACDKVVGNRIHAYWLAVYLEKQKALDRIENYVAREKHKEGQKELRKIRQLILDGYILERSRKGSVSVLAFCDWGYFTRYFTREEFKATSIKSIVSEMAVRKNESADSDSDTEAVIVCMRCEGEIPLRHEGDCPHCGKSYSVKGWELEDDPERARKGLLDEVEFIRNTPPHCIGGFIAKRTSVGEVETDADVEWGISCKCGHSQGHVFGYFCGRTGNVSSPLSFRCDECSREAIFFDESIHGHNRAYDDEDGRPSRRKRTSGRKAGVTCPECSHSSLAVKLFFAHPNGNAVDLDDEPEYAQRIQDFFDQLFCTGKCSRCGYSWEFAQFECV